MDSFQELLKKVGEYGVAVQISHPIVFIEGLPSVKTNEVLVFETGQKGEVFAITRGKVEARVFSHEPVKVGTKVTRTDKLLSIPVGKELLGHTINPLGEPIDPSDSFTPPTENRELHVKPGGISTRAKITKPMLTGISLIDLMIPLGIGQRELIIGDRKTGKTSLILTAVKKQVYEGVIVIYAAIAKKKSDIKKLQEFFIQEKIMSNMIIVATSSYDSPSLIYQTPYAGMSIAEYFRDLGINTLLVLDDLSTHAKFYRELSLLAKRFPGRDSYPGDIFYTHSRLLERGGYFKHPKVGEVAISCFPVIEIVEGDFTGYIATNVMGITDGHLYLDTNIYFQGMRPAVNIPLSVTRVGRQTLDKLSREMNKNLTTFLTSYTKLQTISHFGQELTEDVKRQLVQGELINKFFNQPYQLTVPRPVQLIVISMIMQGIITTKEDLDGLKSGLIAASYSRQYQKMIYDITSAKDVKALDENVMKNKDTLLKLKIVEKTNENTHAANSTPQATNASTPIQNSPQPIQQVNNPQPINELEQHPQSPTSQSNLTPQPNNQENTQQNPSTNQTTT